VSRPFRRLRVLVGVPLVFLGALGLYLLVESARFDPEEVPVK
jgi:hypothetical protein